MNIELLKKYLKDSSVTLIDVGARAGIDKRWNQIAEILETIGFEPDADECARINQDAKGKIYKLRCLPFALGKEHQDNATINICRSPGCSSLYSPNIEFVKEFPFADSMTVVDNFNVELSKLDDVCNSENIVPDCIKVDTQGAELDVLKGGENTLKKTKFLELEVEFNPQYVDQPLFSDLDLYLRSQGFMLLGLRRTFWRRNRNHSFPSSPYGGQIMHGDVIYYNKNLLDAADTDSQTELLKLCIILSLYKQDDMVNFLLGTPHKALQGIPETERIELARTLINKKSGLASFLTGLISLLRKKIFFPQRYLRKFADELQDVDAKDWHDPGFF